MRSNYFQELLNLFWRQYIYLKFVAPSLANRKEAMLYAFLLKIRRVETTNQKLDKKNWLIIILFVCSICCRMGHSNPILNSLVLQRDCCCGCCPSYSAFYGWHEHKLNERHFHFDLSLAGDSIDAIENRYYSLQFWSRANWHQICIDCPSSNHSGMVCPLPIGQPTSNIHCDTQYSERHDEAKTDGESVCSSVAIRHSI